MKKRKAMKRMKTMFINVTDTFDLARFSAIDFQDNTLRELCNNRFYAVQMAGKTEQHHLISQCGVNNRQRLLEKRRQRMEDELCLIEKKECAGAFLLAHAIVNELQKSDFSYYSLGTEGNSVVAYLLGITELEGWDREPRLFLRPDENGAHFAFAVEPRAEASLHKLLETWKRDGIICCKTEGNVSGAGVIANANAAPAKEAAPNRGIIELHFVEALEHLHGVDSDEYGLPFGFFEDETDGALTDFTREHLREIFLELCNRFLNADSEEHPDDNSATKNGHCRLPAQRKSQLLENRIDALIQEQDESMGYLLYGLSDVANEYAFFAGSFCSQENLFKTRDGLLAGLKRRKVPDEMAIRITLKIAEGHAKEVTKEEAQVLADKGLGAEFLEWAETIRYMLSYAKSLQRVLVAARSVYFNHAKKFH